MAVERLSAAGDPAGAAAPATSWEEWSLSTRIEGVDVTTAVVPQQVTRAVESDGAARAAALITEVL